MAKKKPAGVVVELRCFLAVIPDVVDRYVIVAFPTRSSVLLARPMRDLALHYMWLLFCVGAYSAYMYLLFLPPITTAPLWQRVIYFTAAAMLILFLPEVLQLHKLRRTRIIRMAGGDTVDAEEIEGASRPLVLKQTSHVPKMLSLLPLFTRRGLQIRGDLRFWVFIPSDYSLDYRVEVAGTPRNPPLRRIFGPVSRWCRNLVARDAKKLFPVRGAQLLYLERLTVFGPHAYYRWILMMLVTVRFERYGYAAWIASLALFYFVLLFPVTKMLLPSAINGELHLWRRTTGD